MAVEAKGSRFNRNNNLMIAAMFFGFGIYCVYDGYFSESYRAKETDENGKPTANLLFNQYAPIPLGLIATYCLIAAVRNPKKRLVAQEDGLNVCDKELISYKDITYIDHRKFKEKGLITIGYELNNSEKTLKLSDRTYDNLGLLLDELVSKTGAVPKSETSPVTENT